MKRYSNNISFFTYAVIGLFVLRGILNAAIPLMDKTEARYAEIARIMAETNNWVTPQIDYGIPFWAKPPLSTWLSALSFDVFGVNEFAARFPYLLLGFALVFLIGKYAKRERLPFFLPGFILLTIPEFLLHGGVVSTDTALAFCVALTMLSFWEAMQEHAKKYWKYLIFVGIGLGLLAKGPIIGILTMPPIIVWIILFKKTKNVVKMIPFIIGGMLTIGIAVPWYLLAEKATPGFIDYFVVGEHFKRFFDSSWNGDKYGFPKSQPLGIIWAFLLLFALPWIPVVLYKLWKQRHKLFKNEWLAFLVLWLLWTPLFFTFSKSLIHPYIMPVMVPVALLMSHWFPAFKNKKGLSKIALTIPVLLLLVVIVSNTSGYTKNIAPTDKYLIQDQVIEGSGLYHLNSKSYSSQFYSKGHIENITGDNLEKKIKSNKESFMVIISNKAFEEIAVAYQEKLKPLDKNRKKGIYMYSKE